MQTRCSGLLGPASVGVLAAGGGDLLLQPRNLGRTIMVVQILALFATQLLIRRKVGLQRAQLLEGVSAI